ncbi:MAG TPA: alanine--tRNA ligase [Candidatus Brocadiia bacterium]|nr:alanine--tRNA ligase [Candidatus Brocadiia bacterium]
MKTDEIRRRFTSFFERHGHTHVPSDTLVPTGDDTTLFTVAGMQQFKDAFYGRRDMGYKRAVTCQKCIRTGDIDNVGFTPSHQTFFEMLGNFSFGDYFKRDAIFLAWEFMLDELQIPKSKLFISVFEDDDEAHHIWQDLVGVQTDRIFRFGESDNFWPANARTLGPDGPCGPCSEIYFDWGKDVGCCKSDCNPSCNCGRFVEVWNLVFQQYDRQPGGVLVPLSQQNIDTGMGLERISRVMQGVKSNFEIDVFEPVVSQICNVIAPGNPGSIRTSPLVRRIADHARSVTFCVTDGVLPSNEGRGYIVRRLIRRAVRDAAQLGLEKPFLHGLVGKVVHLFGHVYPDLIDRRNQVENVIRAEEEAFLKTVGRGMLILEGHAERMKESGRGTLPGADAFELYATYGFPVEMTESLLREQGLNVDMEAYAAEIEKHKAQSQAGSRFKGPVFGGGPLADLKNVLRQTRFVGYEALSADSVVVAVLNADKSAVVEELAEGQEGSVILDVTPAYAEAGGQIGDMGRMASADGKTHFEFTTVEKTDGFYLHAGKVGAGRITAGIRLSVEVDRETRNATMRNHTATHLLHHALRNVLGDHAHQAGSRVAPDRLRFDFHHHGGMTADELRRVEDIVNARILENHPVATRVASLEAARAEGVIALFGEKYEDKVRVVGVGETGRELSRELCGGTHVGATGCIGSFVILSEGSIGGGLRRIEAVTGTGVMKRMRERDGLISSLSDALGAPETALLKRAADLQGQVKSLQKELSQARSAKSGFSVQQALASAPAVGGAKIVCANLEGASADDLRAAADSIRKAADSVALCLASVREGKVLMIAAMTPDLLKRGLHAGKLLKQISPIVKGGGGGKPDMAQAGGTDPAGIDEALKAAEAELRKALE